MHFSTATKPPRLNEFWDAMKARLNSAQMQQILGGADKVHKRTDDDSVRNRPAPEGQPGRRVIILPVRRAWGSQEHASRQRMVEWLIVAELQRGAQNDDPDVALEAIQHEAFMRLEGWKPSAAELLATHAGDGAVAPLVTFSFPVFRHVAPQQSAEFDDRSGLYYMSSVYRTIAGPPTQ